MNTDMRLVLVEKSDYFDNNQVYMRDLVFEFIPAAHVAPMCEITVDNRRRLTFRVLGEGGDENEMVFDLEELKFIVRQVEAQIGILKDELEKEKRG